MTLHRSAFVQALRKEFPAIEPWLRGYRDGLTLEMMRFRHFTEEAIAQGDLSLVRKCFAFLNRAFTQGNRHVRGSVVVSFLEHLELTGSTGAAAAKLLPAELATERARAIAYLEGLTALPKKRRRSKGAT